MKSGIKITQAVHAGDYKIKLQFSDGHVNTFDYKPLVMSGHEEFKKYLNIKDFKKFTIIQNKTGLAWGNNWEMILPLSTLYNNKTIRYKKVGSSLKMSA